MSDLQDLIHKTSMDCLAKGKQQEQERIIKLLEEKDKVNNESCEHSPKDFYAPCGMCQPHFEPKEIIALIKGEK